jgi:preprotein translocase subunit YajC
MGNMILAATTKSSSPNLLPILIIVVLFVLLYMTMIRPQRNRQRQAMQTQNTVSPGAKIRTTAGIYGTVKAVEDNDIVVEIAPGVNIRMLRRAVMEVVQDGSGVGMPDAAPTSQNGAAASATEPAADESHTEDSHTEDSHADDTRASDLDPQDRNI